MPTILELPAAQRINRRRMLRSGTGCRHIEACFGGHQRRGTIGKMIGVHTSSNITRTLLQGTAMPDRARVAAARTMLPTQADEIRVVATPSVGISQA